MNKRFKNLSAVVLVMFLFSTVVNAVGYLQNEDFKSSTELTNAGGSVSQLLNDTKIYVTASGINQQLSSAISNGLIGGSGSGINYVSSTAGTFENNATTGWATYKNTAGTTPVNGTGGSPTHITFATSATSPLVGTYSAIITNSGSSSAQGEGVSYDFTIDSGYQGKVLNITFPYIINSGTFVAGTQAPSVSNSDLTVYIYDKTNGVVIQPSNYVFPSNSSTVSDIFQGSFQTASNSTSYRLIFHVASTNTSAWSMKVDNISVGPSAPKSVTPVSDWQTYSVSITGSSSNPTKGTTSFDQGYYRRVGDHLEIRYEYQQTAAGSSGSGDYLFSLPSGLTADTSKISVHSNNGATQSLGSASTYDGTTIVDGAVTLYDSTHVSIFLTSGNIGSSRVPLGNTTARIGFEARIPIAGWSSSVQSSTDTDTRVVSARYHGTPTSWSTSSTVYKYSTKDYDTHSAYNTTTGQYTCPVSGIYRVIASSATPGITMGTGDAVINELYKNGSKVSTLGAVSGNGATNIGYTTRGSDEVQCNAGDTLQVNAWRTDTTNGASSSNTDNFIDVTRISGPATIAATEVVGAKVYLTSNSTLNNNTQTTVPFDGVVYDTHGGYNTSTHLYTAPVSGYYSVTAYVDFSSAYSGTSQVEIYKNGSDYARVFYNAAGVQNPLLQGGTTHLKLNAGDTVSTSIIQVSGSSQTMASAGASTPYVTYMDISRDNQ